MFHWGKKLRSFCETKERIASQALACHQCSCTGNPQDKRVSLPLEKSYPILITTVVKQLFFGCFTCAGWLHDLFYCFVQVSRRFSCKCRGLIWPSKTARLTSCGWKRASLTRLVECVVLSLRNLIPKQMQWSIKYFQIFSDFLIHLTQVSHKLQYTHATKYI